MNAYISSSTSSSMVVSKATPTSKPRVTSNNTPTTKPPTSKGGVPRTISKTTSLAVKGGKMADKASEEIVDNVVREELLLDQATSSPITENPIVDSIDSIDPVNPEDDEDQCYTNDHDAPRDEESLLDNDQQDEVVDDENIEIQTEIENLDEPIEIVGDDGEQVDEEDVKLDDITQRKSSGSGDERKGDGEIPIEAVLSRIFVGGVMEPTPAAPIAAQTKAKSPAPKPKVVKKVEQPPKRSNSKPPAAAKPKPVKPAVPRREIGISKPGLPPEARSTNKAPTPRSTPNRVVPKKPVDIKKPEKKEEPVVEQEPVKPAKPEPTAVKTAAVTKRKPVALVKK